MLVFIDTEFTDFINIEMISLGMINEQGDQEFYVEINDYDRNKESDFVRAGIVPMLDHSKYGRSKQQAALDAAAWIESLNANEVIFVADYSSDFMLLQDLLIDVNIDVKKKLHGSMLDKALIATLHERGMHLPQAMSKAFRMVTNSLNNAHQLNNWRVHHALDDAKANRWAFVRALEAAGKV